MHGLDTHRSKVVRPERGVTLSEVSGMIDLVLADIRSPAALAVSEVGCAGFINMEVGRLAGCGHTLHSDLQIRDGDFGAGNQSQDESCAVPSIPIE